MNGLLRTTHRSAIHIRKQTRLRHFGYFLGSINLLSSSAIESISSHTGMGNKRSITTVATTPRQPAQKKRATALASPSPHIEANLAKLQPKATSIAEQLAKLYPNPPIPLNHRSHFELLCAVMLSAQTNDKKVNEVTPGLFDLAPDAKSMANTPLEKIEACIKTLGLAPTKAKNLKATAAQLLNLHDGQVPSTFVELEALPGVGHKTASVIMSQCFGEDAFPVDTHIHRLAQRWGLTIEGGTVEKTEADLKLLFPRELWKDLHLQIIMLGRSHCPAKKHDPLKCPICAWAAVPPFNKPGFSPSPAAKKKKDGKGGASGKQERE